MARRYRTTRIAIGSLAAATALTAASAVPAHADDRPGARRVDVEGDLTRYALLDGGGNDVNPVLAGATARVHSIATPSGKTIITLDVEGLAPNREFGSHVHNKACGATGAAAGPHYQHVVDPVQPSVDPAYANHDNEVWLDFTTDGKGRGSAKAVVDWHLADDATHPDGANSVIVHRDETSHGEPGHPAPGTAGPRLACLTVPFTP